MASEDGGPLWGEGGVTPKDDGGPLFVRDGEMEICRLTVRDAFAALALTGLLQRKNAYKYGIDDDRLGIENAHSAYVLADKMIAERAKNVMDG